MSASRRHPRAPAAGPAQQAARHLGEPRSGSALDEAGRRIQQTILENQGLVYNIAWQIRQRWRHHVEMDDLVQAGNVGLAEAAARYDPSRAQFSTFAYERIRGAMRDFLRKQPWYRFRGVEEQTRDRAEELLADTNVEAASRGETTSDRAWLRNGSRRLAVAYWTGMAIAGGAIGVDPAADQSPTPEDSEARSELIQSLRSLLDALEPREADLIRMTYFEGLTLQQAGDRLKLHKSNVSRMHAKVLDRLAGALRDHLGPKC